MLTTQEESSHHQVDIHPPGIDPIKPVDFHNPPQSRTNDTLLHVGVREAPVDVDIAKVQNFSSIGVIVKKSSPKNLSADSLPTG